MMVLNKRLGDLFKAFNVSKKSLEDSFLIKKPFGVLNQRIDTFLAFWVTLRQCL